MENTVEQLIDSIKNEPCYLNFLESENQLKQPHIQSLLKEYQTLLDAYNESRKYHGYANFDETKLALHTIKQTIANNQIIQDYYKSYNELQSFLQEITHIVFDDISPMLVKGGFEL